MLWLDDLLRQQFGKPSGAIGSLIVGPALNVSSIPLVNAVLDVLQVRDDQLVLDVGFGAGCSVVAALQRTSTGRVTGIDYSWDMVTATARLLGGEARVSICCGDVMRLPFADGSFDRCLSANSIYYWPDPVSALREIRRVLRTGGRVAIGVRSPIRLRAVTWTWKGFRLYEPEEVAAFLEEAGFRCLQTCRRDRWLPLDSVVVSGERV